MMLFTAVNPGRATCDKVGLMSSAGERAAISVCPAFTCTYTLVCVCVRGNIYESLTDQGNVSLSFFFSLLFLQIRVLRQDLNDNGPIDPEKRCISECVVGHLVNARFGLCVRAFLCRHALSPLPVEVN